MKRQSLWLSRVQRKPNSISLKFQCSCLDAHTAWKMVYVELVLGIITMLLPEFVDCLKGFRPMSIKK